MTEKEKQKWAKTNYSHCPFCSGKTLDAETPQGDDNYLRMEVKCLNCAKKWTETYKLVTFEEM